MLQESDYQKVLDFLADLNPLIHSRESNAVFRQECLKLLRLHFGFQRMSFNVLASTIKYPYDFKAPIYDNVTLGLTRELISEYFTKYYKQDVLYVHGRKSGIDFQDVIRVGDVISYVEYEKTDFYQNYYKKYGLYYQVGMSLVRKDEMIGTLSILRGKTEGDFTDDEVDLLRILRVHISNSLVNYLSIEISKLENTALKSQLKNFPVGHIILDEKDIISYANQVAEEYVRDLTGMNLSQFKYFYVNTILPRINTSAEGDENDNFIDLDKYYVKVTKQAAGQQDESSARKYATSVFIQKKARPAAPALGSGRLSAREMEIVNYIQRGLKNAEIADILHLSVYTVKAHIQRIFQKVGVNSKTSLIYRLNVPRD